MDYKSQVYNLIQLLGEKHLDFYFVKNKEDVDSLIEETLNRFNLEDDYDFYYVSNYLIKKIIGDYDEHTEVLMKRKRLPMKVKMYDGKLYIIRGCDEIEPYKFKEITAINHININQIISEFEDKICYSKKEWFGVKLGVSLSSITDIKALPSINADEDIVFTIDGTDVNMTDIYNNAKALPNKPLEPMSYELLDDVIKIKYSLCMEKEEGQMQNMVDEIKQLSQKNSITKYIVDLRGNSGGNSEIIKPLIQFLEGKEIVTIVNNSVYSSGIWACNDLKNIGSTFIGSNIGTRYNRFGNIKREKFGNFDLCYSFKYFYYNEKTKNIDYIDNKESFVKFKNDKKNAKYFIPYDFEIDEQIDTTLEDYIKGNDPVLDRVMELLHSNKKKM